MIKNIYLIGGAPRTGKSTIAKDIAAKFIINYMSMDDIRGLLKDLQPKGISQDLYYDFNLEIEDFYAKYPKPEQVFELEKSQNKAAEAGVEAVIDNFYNWDKLIIERIGITPEYINKLNSLYNAKHVVIAYRDERILKERIYTNGLWDNENAYPDKYKEIEAVWTCMYNQWFISEAEKHHSNFLFCDEVSKEEIEEAIASLWKLD